MRLHSVVVAAGAVGLFIACGGGNGATGSPDAGTPSGGAHAPTLTAAPGQNEAHLSWTAVAGATTYNVYRSGAKGTPGDLLQSVAATQLDDASLTNFQPEWYEVTAVVAGVETAPSNQANAFGYDLTHWSVRAESFALHAFAYAQSNQTASKLPIYVAVGDNGTVITSNDGAAWTIVPQLPSDRLTSITFGNGQFVAAGHTSSGSQNIFTSPDGLTWTTHDSNIVEGMQGLTSGSSGSLAALTTLYVGVGDDNMIATSPDGATWTQRTCGTGLNDFYTVSVVEHAVALDYSFVMFAAGYQSICYSTDGVTWTPLALTGAAATSQFLASVTDDSTSSVWFLDASGVVLQQPYNFASKTLGAPVIQTLPTLGGVWRSIAAVTDAAQVRHIVALHGSGQMFATTASTPAGLAAVTTTVAGTLQNTASQFIASGTAGSSLFLLTSGEQVLRTDNGGAMLAIVRDDPGGTPASIASRDGTTVIVKAQGVVMTSADGATFVLGSSGVAPTVAGSLPMLTTPDRFAVAYVDPANAALQIAESPDAQTWTQTTAPLTLTAGFSPEASGAMISTGGDSYLMSLVEEGPASAVSELTVKGSQAAGFTTSVDVPNLPLIELWSSGGTYYGLTNVFEGQTPAEIVQSTDGVSWTTAATFPMGLYPSWYLDDGATKYVVAYDGTISTSADGTNWSAPVVLDPAGRAVTQLLRMGDHLIAIGNSGLLMASLDGSHWVQLAPQIATDYTGAAVTDRGLAIVGGTDVVLTAP